MIYEAGTPEGNNVLIRKPDSDEVIGFVKSCDTEAGYYDFMDKDQGFKTIRKEEDFDVINKNTGEVLHRVRHSNG